jgi:ribosomal protein S18 acetylase RimI-like enzyme
VTAETIRPIGPDQRDAAAATLAEAFLDDPLLLVMSQDKDRRQRVGPWFFRRAVEYAMRWGEVWGNEDASAIAVWLPPGDSKMKTLRMLRVGMWAMPSRIGVRPTLRLLQGSSTAEQLHNQVADPHWYLLFIGTRRERRGQGLASALLEAGTSRADAAGLPCYLETGTESNLAFYAKRGFETIGQVEMHGFTLWAMVRPPAEPLDPGHNRSDV